MQLMILVRGINLRFFPISAPFQLIVVLTIEIIYVHSRKTTLN